MKLDCAWQYITLVDRPASGAAANVRVPSRFSFDFSHNEPFAPIPEGL